jgi:hypothetical protein
LKKSGAKNFCYSGAWALNTPTPQVQSKKSLFASFSSEKEDPSLLMFLGTFNG